MSYMDIIRAGGSPLFLASLLIRLIFGTPIGYLPRYLYTCNTFFLVIKRCRCMWLAACKLQVEALTPHHIILAHHSNDGQLFVDTRMRVNRAWKLWSLIPELLRNW